MRIHTFTVLVLSFLLCIGCTEEGVEHSTLDADTVAIRAYFDRLSTAINEGDIDTWISFFSDDVVKMPPNEPIVIGKEAVIRWGRPWFDSLYMNESQSIDEIHVHGDLAFTVVTSALEATPKAGGETVQLSVKAVWILERQADSWTCTHHIWNSNEAPPARE